MELVVSWTAIFGFPFFAVGRRFTTWIILPAAEYQVHAQAEIHGLSTVWPDHSGCTVPYIKYGYMITHNIKLHGPASNGDAKSQLIEAVIHN